MYMYVDEEAEAPDRSAVSAILPIPTFEVELSFVAAHIVHGELMINANSRGARGRNKFYTMMVGAPHKKKEGTAPARFKKASAHVKKKKKKARPRKKKTTTTPAPAPATRNKKPPTRLHKGKGRKGRGSRKPPRARK